LKTGKVFGLKRSGLVACGHHQPVGLVRAAVGPDAHPSLQRDPLEDPLVAMDLGPQRLRRHHVGDDAALGREESPLGLEEREMLRGKAVAGVATRQLRAGQHLVREVVELA
jgi:hypothetical protein